MKRLIILLISLLILTVPALQAQAPAQIDLALADFNQRIGLSLTLNDFNWSWSQETYEDASLGCPTEGEVYAQSTIVAYQFLFEWDSTVYDYRVSADSSIVRFCGTSSVDEIQNDVTEITDEEAEQFSNVLCTAPEDSDIVYPRTRLAPQIAARVTPGLPNNIRDGASETAAVIGQIPGGESFTLIAGPFCDDKGLLWWQMEYAGISGYTVEVGPDGDYFLEPKPPLPVATAPEITVSNYSLLQESAVLQGSFFNTLAFSFDNTLLTSGNTGSEGLWIYDLSDLTLAPRIIPTVPRITDIAVSAAESVQGLALVSDAYGQIRLWNTLPDAGLVQRFLLNGHQEPVSTLSLSLDATHFASTGGLALTRVEDPGNQFALIVWDPSTVSQRGLLRGHTGEVIGAHISSDNTRLISVAQDNTLRIWNLSDFTETTQIDLVATPTALAMLDDNVGAVALSDGTVRLLDVATLTLSEPVITLGSALTDVSFSPNGQLLVASSAGGEIAVRDLVNAETAAQTIHIFNPTFGSEISAIDFSKDGTRLAILSTDNLIRILTALQTAG